MSRSDRFKEAFDWLDRKGKVKTKKQLATMMGYDRSVVSNAYVAEKLKKAPSSQTEPQT